MRSSRLGQPFIDAVVQRQVAMKAVAEGNTPLVTNVSVEGSSHGTRQIAIQLFCHVLAVVVKERGFVEGETPLGPLMAPTLNARGFGVHEGAVEVEDDRGEAVEHAPRMPFMSDRILTAVAWPYGNGPRHIGHVS